MNRLRKWWWRRTGRRVWEIGFGNGHGFFTVGRNESDEDLRDTHDWVVGMCDHFGWTLVSHPPVVGR